MYKTGRGRGNGRGARSGGRPPHNYWEKGGFERVDVDGVKKALCIICRAHLSNCSEERMRVHRNRCRPSNDPLSPPQSPEPCNSSHRIDENQNINDVSKDHHPQPSTSLQETNSTSPGSCLPTPKRTKTGKTDKRKIQAYFDYVSPADQLRIDKACVNLFYGCNIPFQVVEHKLFTDFVKCVRPSYIPMTKEKLSEQINVVHDELGLTQSGSSSSSGGILSLAKTTIEQKSHIIGFVTGQKQEKNYLKTWDADLTSPTHYIINEAIQLSAEKHQTKVYAAILEENVQQIDENLINDKVWLLQCTSLSIAAVEAKLIDAEVMKNVLCLLEEFSPTSIHRELVARGGVSIDILNDPLHDKWYLVSMCLKNLRTMAEIMGTRLFKIKKEAIDILLDDTFEDKLTQTLELLAPLHIMREKSLDKNMTVAEITQDWLGLISTEDPSFDSIESEINEFLSPAMLAANLLHPVYRGGHIKNNQARLIAVTTFLIGELEEEGMNSFGQFQDSENLFKDPSLNSYKNAVLYWQTVACAHSNLSSLAIKLARLPVLVPRVQSHPTNLNDLSPIRSEKLKDLFYRLNI